jgi:hypothetical protein
MGKAETLTLNIFRIATALIIAAAGGSSQATPQQSRSTPQYLDGCGLPHEVERLPPDFAGLDIESVTRKLVA